MNKFASQLLKISERSDKLIVGLMAGTSCDGLDVALCRIRSADFDTTVQLEAFQTIPYPYRIRRLLNEVAFQRNVDQKVVCRLHRELGDWFGHKTRDLIHEWNIKPEDVDLIASHGQTIYHQPSSNTSEPASIQIGEADHIARITGRIVVCDFRQKIIAAGGEGAPLTPFVDRLLFSSTKEDRLLLNIGGIANYTWLEKVREDPQKSDFFFSDLGPGNTLIDAAVRYYFSDITYDSEGEIAGKGTVSKKLLKHLLRHPFFEKPAPKSTGPETFNLDWVFRIMHENNLREMSGEDVIATLTQLTVETIYEGLKVLNLETAEEVPLYVSGGGVHNRTLIQNLDLRLENIRVTSFEKLDLNPDAREALTFAVLGNQTISGNGIPIENNQPEYRVHPGKISFP